MLQIFNVSYLSQEVLEIVKCLIEGRKKDNLSFAE